MIEYRKGWFGLYYVFKLRGSVLPKAAAASIMAVAFSLLFLWSGSADVEVQEISTQMYVALSSVLGFLLTFRSGQSYSRFWDGAQTLRLATKEWHDACSQIISFTYTSQAPKQDVEDFQELVVRLVSLMTCSAYQYIADMGEDSFEILDLTGLDAVSLRYLKSLHSPRARMDTCLQWLMQLCVQHQVTGVLGVPAPILTRAFQELSNGTLHFERMKTISDTPFPFPYAQMTSLLLLIHLPMTGWVVSTGGLGTSESGFWGAWCLRATLAFVAVWLLWAMNLVAEEIEHPFGDDANDLPVRELQVDNNEALLELLDPGARRLPTYSPTIRKPTTAVGCLSTSRTIDLALRSIPNLRSESKETGLHDDDYDIQEERCDLDEKSDFCPHALEAQAFQDTHGVITDQPLRPACDKDAHAAHPDDMRVPATSSCAGVDINMLNAADRGRYSSSFKDVLSDQASTVLPIKPRQQTTGSSLVSTMPSDLHPDSDQGLVPTNVPELLPTVLPLTLLSGAELTALTEQDNYDNSPRPRRSKRAAATPLPSPMYVDTADGWVSPDDPACRVSRS